MCGNLQYNIKGIYSAHNIKNKIQVFLDGAKIVHINKFKASHHYAIRYALSIPMMPRWPKLGVKSPKLLAFFFLKIQSEISKKLFRNASSKSGLCLPMMLQLTWHLAHNILSETETPQLYFSKLLKFWFIQTAAGITTRWIMATMWSYSSELLFWGQCSSF